MKLEIRPVACLVVASGRTEYVRCSEQDAMLFGIYIRDFRSHLDATGQPLPRWLVDRPTKQKAKEFVKELKTNATRWACGVSLSLGSAGIEDWLEINEESFGGWIGVVQLCIVSGVLLAVEEVARRLDYYTATDKVATLILECNSVLDYVPSLINKLF